MHTFRREQPRQGRSVGFIRWEQGCVHRLHAGGTGEGAHQPGVNAIHVVDVEAGQEPNRIAVLKIHHADDTPGAETGSSELWNRFRFYRWKGFPTAPLRKASWALLFHFLMGWIGSRLIDAFGQVLDETNPLCNANLLLLGQMTGQTSLTWVGMVHWKRLVALLAKDIRHEIYEGHSWKRFDKLDKPHWLQPWVRVRIKNGRLAELAVGPPTHLVGRLRKLSGKAASFRFVQQRLVICTLWKQAVPHWCETTMRACHPWRDLQTLTRSWLVANKQTGRPGLTCAKLTASC